MDFDSIKKNHPIINQCNDVSSALHVAFQHHDLQLIELIRGNLLHSDDDTPVRNLFKMACTGSDTEYIEWILQIWSSKEDYTIFILETLCVNNHMNIAKSLVINYPVLTGGTHLNVVFKSVCKYGTIKAIKWLITLHRKSDCAKIINNLYRLRPYTEDDILIKSIIYTINFFDIDELNINSVYQNYFNELLDMCHNSCSRIKSASNI